MTIRLPRALPPMPDLSDLPEIGEAAYARLARALDGIPNRTAWRLVRQWMTTLRLRNPQWSTAGAAVWAERKRQRAERRQQPGPVLR